MKKRSVFYVLLLLCILPNTQSMLCADPDKSQWHLPEGAIARLGNGPVKQIAYSPDGSHLAVVSDIGVWIYDALTGTEKALLADYTDEQVMDAVFSPDGDMIAVIVYGYAEDVQIWDTKTWTLKDKLKGYEHRAIDVAFSPDGQTIAIADMGQTTQLWDLSTMTAMCILEGSTDNLGNEGTEFFSVAYGPKGDTFAIGAADGTVCLWDTATGTLKHTLIGNITSDRSFSFSPDGKTIATRSFSNTIWLWDPTTGKHEHTLEEGVDMMGGENIAYSPNGSLIAIPAWDGLQMWDTETDKPINKLENSFGVDNFLFSPDGKTIAFVGMLENNVWTVWLSDPTTGDEKIKLEHTDEVKEIEFSPDGKSIATVSTDNTVLVWDTTTGTYKYMLEHTDSVVGVSYNPDRHNMLTTVHRDRTVWVWNTVRLKGKPTFKLSKHTKGISGVAFSPDGKTLATVGEDRFLHLWGIPTSTFNATSMESVYPKAPLTFSPNGKTLAIGNANGVTLLGVAPRRVRPIRYNQLFKGSTRASVRSIAYSPDGNTIAFAAHGRIVLLDITTEKVVYTLEQVDRNTRIRGVLFSPDGNIIATSMGGEIQLWDISTQTLKITIPKYWGVPLAFSPDGKTIATVDNNEVRLWDTTTGSLKNTVNGHTGPVKWVMFSLDHKSLTTASQDGTVLLWDLTSSHLNSNKED